MRIGLNILKNLVYCPAENCLKMRKLPLCYKQEFNASKLVCICCDYYEWCKKRED